MEIERSIDGSILPTVTWPKFVVRFWAHAGRAQWSPQPTAWNSDVFDVRDARDLAEVAAWAAADGTLYEIFVESGGSSGADETEWCRLSGFDPTLPLNARVSDFVSDADRVAQVLQARARSGYSHPE
ncbi:hypothetical protein QT381_03840 [Galbitalea sp. SE-J8]|uniref:hypothetical protein n=1 Tax=Galbitalea sp. SE-J8 TaxID=3054952 RepID=UPI00259D04D8|nr:hypothetical protein [Galbitalea sp. SE-J8]MDM4762136.1 hypothetical protein [Galbitalea sp. SE-J8]